MKKLLLILLGIVLIPKTLFAAGTAIISGPSSVERGSNVTINVTIRNTAAWNLRMSGNGSTSGCSKVEADVTANGNNTTKTFTLTCKASSVGTINFTVTGDITSQDGSNSNVSLTKQVTVVEPRPKETEPRLNSLTIEGYNIDFNKDVTSYTIEVEPTVNSITINAAAISKYASIIGTGVKTLDSDENVFTITSTAENGDKKEYTINVNVKDSNPINASINGKEYTVYKTNKHLTTPTNYTETTITIGNFQIPAYTNETTKLTIVGIKDTEGNKKYAIYSNGEYKLYNENQSNSLLLYITEKNLKGYKKTEININQNTYTAYEIDDRFALVYAMNINTGKYNYYKYDKQEGTFQYHKIEKTENETNIFMITTILFSITTLILIMFIIYKFLKTKQDKKINNDIKLDKELNNTKENKNTKHKTNKKSAKKN
jgi:hypothetical protein